MIKSQQNWLRQRVKQFVVRSTNLLFVFGIKRNCLRSGGSRSLYPSIRRAIKQAVVISGVSLLQYPAFKINSTCREN
jgi:hypothetical protein